MKAKLKWWPWAVAAVMAVWAASFIFPRSEQGLHVRDFGRLPVLLNGRLQPFDSVARNSLLQLRNKQTAPLKLHFGIWKAERRGKTMSAMEWLLEVLFKPELADTRQVFRIDHPELTALLGLPEANPAAGQDGKHFSYQQLSRSLDSLRDQARRANDQEAAHRTSFERKTLKLWNAISLYQRLKNSVQPESIHDLAAAINEFADAAQAGAAAVRARQAGEPFNQGDFDRLVGQLRAFEPVAQLAYPLVIPPADPATSPDDWENLGMAVLKAARTGELHPAVHFYGEMATAYHDGRTNEFNRVLKEYGDWLSQDLEGALAKAEAETRFNAFEPFYRAMVIDVLAFLFICAHWVRFSENSRRAGVWLLVVGVVIHTAGLLYRMILEGRPPVTNLYSSAIFIGWGSALLGLFLERIHRLGIGVAAGGCIGFVTLVIAHNLGMGGDTMEMMRAVLDDNFWLATHVVIITLGYSAMFLAGFLGILLLVLGVFSKAVKPVDLTMIGRLIYGIICFATLFSFVGTILGGIWADQSWGRFWGWDPKENGALIIVLWCAVILHSRWGGLVRERGLAAMAVFGNIVTSFSWFGVNMLGVGLHSYGFMDAAFLWLSLFVISQLLIIGLAFIPTELWVSRRAAAPTRVARPARA